MTKIGHQELVLEAVELLRHLHYNLTSETLQSLALKLGCKAQSLFNSLKRVGQDATDSGKKERVSVETLSGVSDLINLVKQLISWLDRYPFVGQDNYIEVRKTILKLSVELASTAQRDQFAENPHKVIKETCAKLTAQSDKIVQEFNDSLIIQPASLEVGKIKRKLDDDLGIHINSLCTGVHIIEEIKFQSPAYRSGKIEEGDEIVQVNYQTVIGWQIKNIICAMKEHPTEVHLTLKKRPRHPNVLGQVITLWPYRIPSKKTAFRKMYKWNKGKATVDIRNMCSKSPGTRGEITSISETNAELISEKEKLFAVNKPRNKLRRRATVTGVSPTALRAPVSLEELIGGNSKRKESVLRTISYDPNKTIDLDDNVFNRDAQNNSENQSEVSQKSKKDENSAQDKKESSTKNAFLRPPQEKYMSGHLKRQEALKNSETVARAAAHKPSPLTLSTNTNQTNANSSSGNNIQQDTTPATPDPVPSGNQSPKQKIAEWVNKQRKKQEGLLQHALSVFSQESNLPPSSSTQNKECGSPKSPKSSIGSPKGKKGSGNIFNFSLREGRPSLSELRALKKTANSRIFSERVNTLENSTGPKQPLLQKRGQTPPKKIGYNYAKPIKDPRIEDMKKEPLNQKYSNKISDSYIHPRYINYSKIPEFPCEMHESKIVSLKKKTNNNIPPPPYKSIQNSNSSSLTSKNIQQKTANHTHKTNLSVFHKTQKPNHSSAYYSPSGRSLSFNNIVASSDDSSSDEYEIYEELCDESELKNQHFVQKLNVHPEMDVNFRRQLAEVYNMLSQRQNIGNNGYKGSINPPSSAVIDELALRMYHALQMNHLQSQRNIPQRPPQYNTIVNNSTNSNLPYKNNMSYHNGTKNIPQDPYLQMYKKDYIPNGTEDQFLSQIKPNSVHEHPVDLPPSALPPRHINAIFKTATSQEIHNLYTSQVVNKNGTGQIVQDNDKHLDISDEKEFCNKDHTYEIIPYHKNLSNNFETEKHIDKCNSNFIYPAEKELELEIPCRDNQYSEIKAPKPMFPNNNDKPNFKGIKDNIFCPIKESFTQKQHSENNSAFKVVETSRNANSYKENSINSNTNRNLIHEASLKSNTITNCDEKTKDLSIEPEKNVQPAISSIILNIPKPPNISYSPAMTKSSSCQTDAELCNSNLIEIENDTSSKTDSLLNNDDSFQSSLNSTTNSITGSPCYSSSSSSLSSSSSGSVLSSTGSCYYYVETQIRPQFTMKFPPTSANVMENSEDSPLIDLRSPTLPTMGVSMLSKKRSTSSSGSEQGSNAGSRASPNIPAIIIEPIMKNSPKIMTDVEQTI